MHTISQNAYRNLQRTVRKEAVRIERECADVANFAMMIADIVRNRRRAV